MITGIKIRNIFLRLVPYIICFFSGILVYFLADIHIKNQGLNSLTINIAAALLSIPVIFIFYEVINQACSKDIKESLINHLTFDINYVIVDAIKIIRVLLGINDELTPESLTSLLSKDGKYIHKHLQLTPDLVERLKDNKSRLQGLVYGNANLEALSDQQIKCLLSLVKRLGILEHEMNFNFEQLDKVFIEQVIAELLSLMGRWIELGEEDAIINHHSFTIL